MVLESFKKKGLPDEILKRYINLYSKNYSKIVVNGIGGRVIENKRLSIRQGDKCAMELFTYGMDPTIYYLEKRLKGIIIFSSPRHGPVLQPANIDQLETAPNNAQTANVTANETVPNDPQTANVSANANVTVSLPTLPHPYTKKSGVYLPARINSHAIPNFNTHNNKNTLPPLVTKYIVTSYCDDLKPSINSMEELILVNETMIIFEYSSGCKIHRTALSNKCKFLGLGAYKNIQQTDLPYEFFCVSDHLDFLGTILNRTSAKSRTSNGDLALKRVKDTLGPWKVGKFLPMSLRAHMINTWAISKTYHISNIFRLRVGDINLIFSAFKNFLFCDMLEWPEENISLRPITAGGLELFDIEMRSLSFLINNFLQTSINPNFRRNTYHEALLNCYVFDIDLQKKPAIPPYFGGNFFESVKIVKNVYDLQK